MKAFRHNCGLSVKGELWCTDWHEEGAYRYGELSGIAQMPLGPLGCFVLNDGRVVCSRGGSTSYDPVPGINDAESVVHGVGSQCVLRASGRVSCLGDGFQGNVPLDQPHFANAVELASTPYGPTCVLTRSGDVIPLIFAVTNA